jgi:hypothetical protein
MSTPVNPAGLDQLIMAAGKAASRFIENKGFPFAIWDGPDGFGAVLREHLDAAKVPNKTLPEMFTARDFVNRAKQAKRMRIVSRKRRGAA